MKIAAPTAFGKALVNILKLWDPEGRVPVEWHLAQAYGPMPSVEAWLKVGLVFDVVLMPMTSLQTHIKNGQLDSCRLEEVFRAGVGIALSEDFRASVDISDIDALKSLLLSAPAIFVTEGNSGKHFVNSVLPRLGIENDLKAKLQIVQARELSSNVSKQPGALGIQLLCELIGQRGLKVLGPLPPFLQHHVMVGASLTSSGINSVHAASFFECLNGSVYESILSQVGLDK